ncbi:hypothetical protein A3K73_03495 [Candidatus Pacearchaeota archaeon RBG_13_36_9]|nr:MAG: hypothetical protein A3K73_03495 [Candidatus Pacearchaeota archaeon RBG_13_36_9]
MGKDLEKDVEGVVSLGEVFGLDLSKYVGEYVSIAEYGAAKVIAHGKNIGKVIGRAVRRAGHGNFFTIPVHDSYEAGAPG